MFHERVLASFRLYDYLALHIRERVAMSISTDCVGLVHSLSFPIRQNSPTESFDKQVDRAVPVCFPGIPRGVDVNPLHSFATKTNNDTSATCDRTVDTIHVFNFFPRRARSIRLRSANERHHLSTYPLVRRIRSMYMCSSHLLCGKCKNKNAKL